MKKEIWKPVKGYEGIYEVSNMGRLRSLDRRVNSSVGGRFAKGQLITPEVVRHGYLRFSLSKNWKKYRPQAHRLVAEHFVPNPENKPEINHKNGIKDDNRASNLEWVTSSENTRHAIENGWHTNEHLTGEKSPVSKLTRKDVIKIKKLLAEGDLNQREISELFPVSSSVISNINTGRAWTHVEVPNA